MISVGACSTSEASDSGDGGRNEVGDEVGEE